LGRGGRRPHPVKRPYPASFLVDPLLVKERVREEGQERTNRRLFIGFTLLILTLSFLKERVDEERGGVRSLDGVRFYWGEVSVRVLSSL